MGGRVEEGWAELRAGRWQAARSSFSEALSERETAEAFEGLSWAAWWLDDAEVLFAAREQAFRLYRDEGEAAAAARMATWLAADELDFRGALALASGWLDRARRLLEDVATGPEHGWLAFHRGFVALVKGDVDAAEADGLRAAEIGRKFGVADLEMLGLALQGSTLVSRARVRDGMRCLDEASALALGGEATIAISCAWTCCFLVTACTRVLDFERAFEWCDRIAEFAERYGSRYMLGFCRAEYAMVHLWRGAWQEAEAALDESIEALSASRPPMVEGPVAQLAELRRRQGRIEESERLLASAGVSSGAQLCRARLALDRGEAMRARDLAERVLRSAEAPLDGLPALELLVRAQIACGELDAAASAVGELSDVAREVATPALRARAAWSSGVLAEARGEHERAQTLLEDAVDGFDRCRAPFDAACARLALAETLASLGRREEAQREARAAHDVLLALGAATEAERALGITERAGAAQRAAPVSRREREVLALLAKGLTNREISARLFISEHTVHRHVTNILRKLDLPSRAAAAAHAVRAGWVDRTE